MPQNEAQEDIELLLLRLTFLEISFAELINEEPLLPVNLTGLFDEIYFQDVKGVDEIWKYLD